VMKQVRANLQGTDDDPTLLGLEWGF